MIHTAHRFEECQRLSCADYTARYPQPVLVAVEISAGVLKVSEKKRRIPEPQPTRQTFRTNGRRYQGSGWAPPRRAPRKSKPTSPPGMPNLRQETMENDRNVAPGTPGVDPAMLHDRPIARPYFFELRKTIREHSGKVMIGRVQPNDVVINDFTISLRHACFEYHPHHQAFLLTDLGSTNGTRVEGRRLPPHQQVVIRSHSLIEFGRIKVRFLTAPHFYHWLLARAA